MDHSWFFLALTLPVVAVLARLGMFKPTAMDASPPRRVELDLTDLGKGFVLIFLGMACLSLILPALGLSQTAPTPASPDLAAQRYTIRALIDQGFTQLPVVLYLLWRVGSQHGGLHRLGVIPTPTARLVLVAGVGLVIAVVTAAGVGELMVMVSSALGQPTPKLGHEALRMLHQSPSAWTTTGLVISAVVLAPLLEESIFRALVQTVLLNTLGRSRRWLTVFIASGFFTLVHASVPWQVLPSLFVLSLVLGSVYERTGSLLPCWLIHVGFNSLNLIMALWVVGPTP